MASQVLYFLIEFSESIQSRMKYSNACEVFALATRGKFRTETMGITYKAPTKNVLWTSVIVLDSVGLAKEQEKTLCLGNMRNSAYLITTFSGK